MEFRFAPSQLEAGVGDNHRLGLCALKLLTLRSFLMFGHCDVADADGRVAAS